MTQANEKSIWTESFIAGADLSAKQYLGMKLSAARTVVTMAADTDIPCGILLNQPKSGQEALVCVMGRSPVKFGGTVTAGMLIRDNGDGTMVEFAPLTDQELFCLGQCSVGGASGEMGEALICAANPNKGDDNGA